MAAPRRTNNHAISNVRTTAVRQSSQTPTASSKTSGYKATKTNPALSRRVSGANNISYISTNKDLPPYPSTDQIYSANAYQDNILGTTTNAQPEKPPVDADESPEQPFRGRPRREERRGRQSVERIKQAIGKAKGKLTEADLYEDGDVEKLLSAKKEPEPNFPTFMFVIAILKDLIDVVELTIIGIIFTKILSIIFLIILAFWLLGKVKGKWWKKKVLGWMWKRLMLASIVELIPFLALAPMMTIFVIMAHKRETKVVKAINFALEELKRVGAFNRII